MEENQERKFICDSDDLPGYVWVVSSKMHYLIPKSRAEEEGLI